MTEQTVQDLVQRIAQMEEHMSTAGQANRDAGSRAQAAENRAGAAETAAGAAGVRQSTVPAALVDTRLLGKPRAPSGALADGTSWRFTFTAYARALEPRYEEVDGE